MKPQPDPIPIKTELIMGPMSRAELTRYAALKEQLARDLDFIQTAFNRVGRTLGQIRDQRLYRGEFDTFEQFCKSIVGKNPRYVHRLIQAHGVIEDLLLQGVKETELPNSERVCRELAEYPAPNLKLIYKRALQMSLAAGKSQPDSMTIREAAATIEGSAEARRRQLAELIQRFEGIARKMKVTIGWGDMESPEIIRLSTALEIIAWLAKNHLASLPTEFIRESEPSEEEIKRKLGKLTNTLSAKKNEGDASE